MPAAGAAAVLSVRIAFHASQQVMMRASSAIDSQCPLRLGRIIALPSLSGGTAQVALRFTELTGSSQIDDVYVDPRMHW